MEEKKLRKQSEAKTTEKAEKPSAAERTIPIPGTVTPYERFQCAGCSEIVEVKKCTTRADGSIECPECGMPRDPMDHAGVLDDAPKSSFPIGDLTKQPKAFCDQCGAEWPRLEVNQFRPFPNCGHTEGFVDDPKKAKRWKPPAGHPRPPVDDVVAAQRAAQDIADVSDRREAEREMKRTKPPSVEGTMVPKLTTTETPSGSVRLNLEWGKLTINRGHYSTIGPFALHADVKREDVQETGRWMLDQCEKLAEEALKRQRAWFRRTMALIDAENEKGG